MSITLAAISVNAIKVRWREPYASDGLNRKVATLIPAGVYRGLRLSVSVANLSVDLTADPTFGDHIAVQETSDGASTTYRDTSSGTITLSLSSFSTSDVIIIAIYVNYLAGTTTQAEFRGMLLSEYNGLSTAAKSMLIPLGTVIRPASGIIPQTNIAHDRRKIPFLQRTDEATPWNPLIRNGGFEMGQTNGTYRHSSPFWKSSVTNSNFTIRPVETESNSGVKSLEMTTSVIGAVTATIQQDLWVPVIPGRLVMGRLSKKAIQAATSAPTGRMRFVFGDKDGLNDTNDDLIFQISSIDSAFVEMDGVVQVPAGMHVLKSVQIILAGTYGATGPCIRLDDIGAWAQVDGANWLDIRDARSPETSVGDLFLGAANSFANASAKLSFDGTSINIERRDEDLTLAPPAISIQPRTTGSIEYTLLLKSVPASGKGYRKYMSAQGSMLDVVNASYDNGTNLWTKDVAGSPAFRQEAVSTGFVSSSRVADTAWVDSAWIKHVETHNPDISTYANQSFAPVLAARDAVGNRRVIIDHLGFSGGRVIREDIIWTDSPPFAYGWTSTGISSYSDFSTCYNNPQCFKSVQLQVSTTGNVTNLISPIWVTAPLPANSLVVLEWVAMQSMNNPINTSSPGVNVTMGWGVAGAQRIGFDKSDGSVNWKFITSTSANVTTTTDTLVQLIPNSGAAPGCQTFRIELYGSAQVGGAVRALGYVDGALVAEVTTTMPDAPMRASFVNTWVSGLSSPRDISIGPVSVRIGTQLSEYAL